jgi:hypothetical protein
MRGGDDRGGAGGGAGGGIDEVKHAGWPLGLPELPGQYEQVVALAGHM